MTIQPILLWSDLFIWLLVLACIGAAWWSVKQPPVRVAWARVGHSRPGMAAATVLLVFAVIGLADSLHYRPQLPAKEGEKPVYAVEVSSALDALLMPLRSRNEKTYSEPLATRAYAKEMQEVKQPDGSVRNLRDYPRLKFGGAHLGNETEAGGDIAGRCLQALLVVALAWAALAGSLRA
jgi:peptide/nickel transport system permease protein